MDARTRDELFRLAAIGKEQGLDRAVRWIMAGMQAEDRKGKRRKRKRRARVTLHGVPVRGGAFEVELDRLQGGNG